MILSINNLYKKIIGKPRSNIFFEIDEIVVICEDIYAWNGYTLIYKDKYVKHLGYSEVLRSVEIIMGKFELHPLLEQLI